MPEPVMPVLALTGGIGTGKSKVATLLRQLGAVVINTDDLARAALRPDGAAYQAVVDYFGPEILRQDGSGEIDRDALADIVFADADKRRKLESLVHPVVRRDLADQIAHLRLSPKPPPAVIVEIPLLFETDRRSDFDAVWVVYAPAQVAAQRLVGGRSMTERQVQARMQAQLPIEEKSALADVVIDNSADWANTARQVFQAWRNVIRQSKANQAGKP